MKVVATGEGLALVLTQTDQATILKVSNPTPFNPRQVLEHLAAVWSANLEQDCNDAISELEENAAS